MTKAIDEFDISSTIHGVISGRLDRLEKETKRILQEASVIGRAFLYDILKRITELKNRVDQSLQGLERHDLIRTRSLQPDLEYIFKHSLTQEVVYNGLLKKERKAIHERIGLVMEHLFQDRLPEFYEALAFHFTRGQSVLKAVDYLVKSGEKSLKRYAVEESHQYFKQAYDIVSHKSGKTIEDQTILIDLIIRWAFVFYYRGDVIGMKTLFTKHEADAMLLNNKAKLGMFKAWMGFNKWCQGAELENAYQYLLNAFKLGEESGDQKVVGYSCTWLTWVCAELGLFDEAIAYGKRAREIARNFPSDQYLNFKPLAGDVPLSEIPMSAGVHMQDEGYMMTDMVFPAATTALFTAQVFRFDKMFSRRNTLQILVKSKDELGGKLTDSGGVRKILDKNEKQKLAKGYERAKEILKNAGAKSLFKTGYLATHPGGTIKVGDLLDSDLKTEYDNLYVCDCSVIPQSWGLPPTATIIGLGKRLAKHLSGESTKQESPAAVPAAQEEEVSPA